MKKNPITPYPLKSIDHYEKTHYIITAILLIVLSKLYMRRKGIRAVNILRATAVRTMAEKAAPIKEGLTKIQIQGTGTENTDKNTNPI